ncbi:MAG: sugar phosphate isomerase/epimerase family protein [Bryobacteraceae bacterium]
MTPTIPIAAVTDEFSANLPIALPAMAAIGMTGAELRVVNVGAGVKNVMDLTDDECKLARDLLAEHGMQVVSLASPLLKCVLPDAPEVDTRFQQDIFNSKHTFADQPRLADRAFALAEFFGAPIIRVFSYWRTVDPDQCFDRICSALTALATDAASRGVTIGLENEHACNIGTAAESARVLAAVHHSNVKLVWDPANALVGGEVPFPDGFSLLPVARIAHVHAKDGRMVTAEDGSHVAEWGPLGTRHVDWKGQIAALRTAGYKGWISLETHWPGPGGNKMEASKICGWNLRGLVSE